MGDQDSTGEVIEHVGRPRQRRCDLPEAASAVCVDVRPSSNFEVIGFGRMRFVALVFVFLATAAAAQSFDRSTPAAYRQRVAPLLSPLPEGAVPGDETAPVVCELDELALSVDAQG